MSLIDVRLPKLGESIVSATIVTWLVAEGAHAERDQPLVEVSTDKVNSEIPAPVSGRLVEIVAKENDPVEVGDVIARIETGESAPIDNIPAENISDETATARAAQAPSHESAHVLSPAVLRLAAEHGIAIDEIRSHVKGSGEGGRVSKRDLLAYVESKTGSDSADVAKAGHSHCGGERVKMSALRRAIAENMVRSFYAAPHASLVQSVDITDLLAHISANKAAFFERHGFKLSVTSFVAKAMCHALKTFPWLNSSLDGDTIVVKPMVNLGVAVGVEGGVVVPVVRGAQALSIPELARSISILAKNARDETLSTEQTSHGSITLTNFGMSGVEIGVPIIRYPEVAIVGLGATKRRPGFDASGAVVARDEVHISLTFDHRVLDGMYGCGFMQALKKALEEEALTWPLD